VFERNLKSQAPLRHPHGSPLRVSARELSLRPPHGARVEDICKALPAAGLPGGASRESADRFRVIPRQGWATPLAFPTTPAPGER